MGAFAALSLLGFVFGWLPFLWILFAFGFEDISNPFVALIFLASLGGATLSLLATYFAVYHFSEPFSRLSRLRRSVIIFGALSAVCALLIFSRMYTEDCSFIGMC